MRTNISIEIICLEKLHRKKNMNDELSAYSIYLKISQKVYPRYFTMNTVNVSLIFFAALAGKSNIWGIKQYKDAHWKNIHPIYDTRMLSNMLPCHWHSINTTIHGIMFGWYYIMLRVTGFCFLFIFSTKKA